MLGLDSSTSFSIDLDIGKKLGPLRVHAWISNGVHLLISFAACSSLRPMTTESTPSATMDLVKLRTEKKSPPPFREMDEVHTTSFIYSTFFSLSVSNGTTNDSPSLNRYSVMCRTIRNGGKDQARHQERAEQNH